MDANFGFPFDQQIQQHPCLSVQHDLLLALLGHVGDLFIDASLDKHGRSKAKDARVSSFKVASWAHWIDPCDRDVLQRLLELGYHYSAIEDFILLKSSSSESEEPSAFCKALATGLTELLDVYRAAVLHVQQLFRSNQSFTHSSLYYYFEEFQVLLPNIHEVVYQVQTKNLAGVSILQLLHSKAQSGIPELQSCVSRLLWHCHQVFFKMLRAWMVHGYLIDRHAEFLIQRAPEFGDEDEEEAAAYDAGRRSDVKPAEWQSAFQVSVAALPPFLSLATAESILFVGKAVRVLRQGGPAGQQLDSSDQVCKMKHVDAALQALQMAEELHPLDLEHIVEAIRSKVAGDLWQLVVVKADLPAHLKALKDYFLLARGDFICTFLHESRSLMAMPPRLATVDADITVPFQQSALKSTAESDCMFSRVRLLFAPSSAHRRIASQPKDGRQEGQQAASRGPYVPALDKWDDLSLDYQVEWPLHLLFTPEVLGKYNLLFQYLLRLKRVGLGLEDAWGSLKRGQLAAQGRGVAQLWHVRQHMAHMINNLQIYVQVDVIEAQFALLSSRIRGARDFKEVERAHQAYLDALLSQCFLDMRQIGQMLEAVFALCQRLCNYIQEASSADETADKASLLDKCAALAADFRKRAGLLYTLLQSNRLQSSPRAPYLRQLLLRLNFNSFVETQARQLLRQELANQASSSKVAHR